MKLSDIHIRTTPNPGDLGYISYLHGKIYAEEYQFGIEFDSYVAESLLELYKDLENNCFWLAEHEDRIIGCLALVHRERVAQLRFFLIQQSYRGLGLGKKLMDAFFTKLHERQYASCYLWTKDGLPTAKGLYLRYGFELVEEKESLTFGKVALEQKYEVSFK